MQNLTSKLKSKGQKLMFVLLTSCLETENLIIVGRISVKGGLRFSGSPDTGELVEMLHQGSKKVSES